MYKVNIRLLKILDAVSYSSLINKKKMLNLLGPKTWCTTKPFGYHKNSLKIDNFSSKRTYNK